MRSDNEQRRFSYVPKPGETEKIGTFKFRLENTINGDPEAPKQGLKVMRSYLDFLSGAKCSYRSTTDIAAETGLSFDTIRETRNALIKLGYMRERGREASGAILYEIKNERAAIVFEHVEGVRSKLRQSETEKKNAARIKTRSSDVVPPRKSGDTDAQDCRLSPENSASCPPEISGDVPLILGGNTVEHNVEEGEGAFAPSSISHSTFTVDGLDKLSDNERIPPVAAEAARAIVERLIEGIFPEREPITYEALKIMLGRGKLTKKLAREAVKEANKGGNVQKFLGVSR